MYISLNCNAWLLKSNEILEINDAYSEGDAITLKNYADVYFLTNKNEYATFYNNTYNYIGISIHKNDSESLEVYNNILKDIYSKILICELAEGETSKEYIDYYIYTYKQDLTNYYNKSTPIPDSALQSSKLYNGSQLFNRNITIDQCDNKYVQESNNIVSARFTLSFPLIRINPSKRYIVYFTNPSILSGTGYSTVVSILKNGGLNENASRKIGTITSNISSLTFTTTENEYYIFIEIRNATKINNEYIFNNNTAFGFIQYIGVEQLDNGYDYKNEDYIEPTKILDIKEENLSEEIRNKLNNITVVDFYKINNPWKNKRIIWFGTSIPAGSDPSLNSQGLGQTYPQMVADLLEAECINKALGSSMCRCNVRTGDYNGVMDLNCNLSLSATIEEKNYFADNFDTISPLLMGGHSSYYTNGEAARSVGIAASFENRLMPYLNGTYEMPDLFVLDHGHNDWKYKMPDNTTLDIDILPTPENISSGLLARDGFMLDNNYEKLINILGVTPKIKSSQQEAFYASLNRNCYVGAMNFIITVILTHNPRARIVFISNNTTDDKVKLLSTQQYLADSWNFPLIKVCNKLGLGSHIIPGTYNTWSDENQYDLTQKNTYCKDNVHPHSDNTYQTMQNYARTIAFELLNCY